MEMFYGLAPWEVNEVRDIQKPSQSSLETVMWRVNVPFLIHIFRARQTAVRWPWETTSFQQMSVKNRSLK